METKTNKNMHNITNITFYDTRVKLLKKDSLKIAQVETELNTVLLI